MSDRLPGSDESENDVTVHYWGALRAAAGVETEVVSARTLADVLDAITASRRGDRRFADVLGTCGVLVGEVPVGSRPPEDVRLSRGDRIELLPPFAGGAH